MKQLAVSLSVAILSCLSAAHAQTPLSNEGGMATDLKNEKEIRRQYEEFTAAWNRHDGAALGAMWTLDGDHLEPDGTRAKGRKNVASLLQKQHESVFKTSTLTLTIEDVWFVTQEVALIDGGYEITGVRLPDGTELPARKGHLTAMLLKEQGRWWIAASRLMIPAPLPYKK